MATASQHGEESKESSDCSMNQSCLIKKTDESPVSSNTIENSMELLAAVVAAVDDEGLHSGVRETVLSPTTSGVPEGMTKTQWKKHLRQQRRMIAWERNKVLKKEKRAAERERRLKERELAEKEGRPLPTKRTQSDQDTAPLPRKKFKKMSSSDASPIKVAIDFGFEDLMTDKDIKMLVKQCQRCYSQNRRAEAPLQLYWTNFGGRSKERLDAVMSYKNWDVHMRSHGYIEEFGKDNVVFLTSDSPHILTELDPSKAYIIGGLVDHNHHKGYCFKHAVEQGIAHAQLPIAEYVKLNCRTVLAINHVFEILLAFSQNKDWKKSFYQVIPPRKVGDKNDEDRPHQSAEDTEELNTDHPTTPQYQASGDQNETMGVISHCSPKVQMESKKSEIVASHQNKEDCCDSENDTSEGSNAVIV